jgi:hypothetical protein
VIVRGEGQNSKGDDVLINGSILAKGRRLQMGVTFALKTSLLALLVASCSAPVAKRSQNGPAGVEKQLTGVVGSLPEQSPSIIAPRKTYQPTDDRDTAQLCHDLLHGGVRPANAAQDPQRCE